jgi:hypothetical protein
VNAYNFQEQFAEPIKRGVKRSTIRARRKTGYVPLVGEALKLYTGMRTRSCELLRMVVTTNVRPILIYHDETPVRVVLDGHVLAAGHVNDLWKQEGFASVREFAEFFSKTHASGAPLYLIEW